MLARYLIPKVDITPANKPIHKAAAGLVKSPLGAPIITPPAKVALRMSYILNFSLTTDVIIHVPIQLPVKAMIVLAMTILFS